MDDDPENPTTTALHLVLAVHRLMRSLRRFRTDTSLHPTQLLVLSTLIDAGPMRIGELAASVPCSQPTATNVVAGLASLGLVRRVPDTADGRAIRVELADAGRSAIVSIARHEAELLDGRLDDLSEQDRQTVLAAVPILHRMARPRTVVSPDGAVAAGTAGSSRQSDS